MAAYATLFFGDYDDELQRLRYANCGHLDALVVRCDGSLERLESTGTVLGLFPEWGCGVGECKLGDGDTLALYTDGVTEASNLHGEEFGEDRLINLMRRHHALPPGGLIAAITEELRQFSPQEQHDDITLMVAKCAGRTLQP
jgi:serine phosphatase RsbU (regulator of sigma subunit)